MFTYRSLQCDISQKNQSKIRKIILSSLLFLVSIGQSGQAKGQEVETPDCSSITGQPVQYIAGDERDLLRYNTRLSLATHVDIEGPTIIYDKAILEYPRERVDFILEHECAHHYLGHVEQLRTAPKVIEKVPGTIFQTRRNALDSLRHQFELEADCASVKKLQTEYGYNANQIENAFGVLEEFSNTANHPSYAERKQNMMSCLRSLNPVKR